MRTIDTFILELKQFHLPIGQFVIVSSGALAIRNIRECKDLDVLVTAELFDDLAKSYPSEQIDEMRRISIGNIDFLNFPLSDTDRYPAERQIREADLIDGIPFQNLATCRYFKSISDREKDKVDLVLIDEYLKNKETSMI